MKFYFKIYQSGAASYLEFPFGNDFNILSYGYKFQSNDYNACTIVINSYDQQLKNSKNQIESLLNEKLEQTPFSSLVVNSVFGAVTALTINDYSVFFGLVECEVTLKESSAVPDYTQVLTDISNNIKNLLYTVSSNISSSSNIYNTSSLRNLANLIYCFSSNISSPANTFNNSLFNQISSTINQLNNNIHNDLTNINTTAENKDNVLIVDGQQTFKIRNSDEEI